MRLTAAFVAHELRTQWRSLRFRTAAGLYAGAGALPAFLVHLLRTKTPYVVGEGTYAMEVMNVLPLLTVALAFLLSLDGIAREQGDGAWTTVTLCGVSNAGYLLRRWIALQTVILPLTAVPFLTTAGVAIADGAAPLSPWIYAGPWLLQIAPLALAVSALGLGIGTIGGGALGSLPLLASVLALVPAFGNELLHRFHLRLNPPLGWLDGTAAAWSGLRAVRTLQSRNDWGWLFPVPGTESGFDFGTLGVQHFVEGAPLAALAAAALGIATVYLRRTRPDLRPRPVRPDHPFRGSLLAWSRLRERYKPDPAPAPTDRLAVATGLLIAIALLGALIARAYDYESLAAARFATETQAAPAPIPPGVVPGRWRIEGRIGPGRQVALQVAGEMVNIGKEPVGHLAFQLNPDLAMEVTADAGRVTSSRLWERLGLDLEPPIPPGGRRELRFHLSGEPARVVFPMATGGMFGKATFASSYTQHRDALFSRDRINYALSFRAPAVSGFRVDLSHGGLVPVPQYGGWKEEDAPETISPSAQVEISLAGPPGLFLADSCGGIAAPSPGGGTRLASRCRLPLTDLAVAGGRHRLLRGMEGRESGGMAVAVFPAHAGAAELHLGFLAQSAGMLDEAWPGIGSLGRLTVVEQPQARIHERTSGQMFRGWYRAPEDEWVTVEGNLILLEESDLIQLKELQPEHLVAEILAARLAGRRRILPGQALFFRQLFKNLSLERLGLGPRNGAVVGPLHPSDEAAVQAPVFGKEVWYAYWQSRFPALISALKSRMGDEPLRQAMEEFLARGNDPAAGAGSAEELFEVLARHSPRPVDRLIRDALLDGGLPYPLLDGVAFRRAGDVWRVTGRMVNQGRGEALCRVVLTTDLGQESTELRADSGQTASFELATRQRPQGVFLDPDHACHRLVKKGAPRDVVYFEGSAR